MLATIKRFAAAAIFALGFGHAAAAAPITFVAVMNGANESPSNSSLGTGLATVTIDTVANSMVVDATFSGLTGTSTAAHIHCCTTTPFSGTAGVATTSPTFAGFPLGVTSGTYHMTFDMTQASSYNPAFVTAQGGLSSAETAFFSGMISGNEYFNIHTSFAPGGEIRGFLRPVPEPITLALFGFGLAGLGLLRRSARTRS